MRNLLSFIAVWTVVLFVLLFYGIALADQKQDVEESKSYSAAKQLEGRWLRQDGGYILDLQDIRPDGNMKAFYFNPRNINVHEASWKFDDERLILYVELRDVNYPGSNYTLMYRASKDFLWGSYFQAVQKQTMNVNFVRMK